MEGLLFSQFIHVLTQNMGMESGRNMSVSKESLEEHCLWLHLQVCSLLSGQNSLRLQQQFLPLLIFF